jgi:hypothetical protein
MKQGPYRGPTNIRPHRAVSRRGDPAPGICEPINYNFKSRKSSYYFKALRSLYFEDVSRSTLCHRVNTSTLGCCFVTVPFTIHFYDPCRVGPSTPDLWCITVATKASFLYLVRFYIFSGVQVFILFMF